MEIKNKHDELMNEHGEVFNVLVKWFGNMTFNVLHFWDTDDTFYIVIRHKNGQNNVVTMIRVFWLSSGFELSVDNSIFL